MNNVVSVTIDETAVLSHCREQIRVLISQIESEYVFWDAAELKKRTCMSWNTIQDNFFFDPRFIKRKIGGKWYFPVKETKEFLELWLHEQSTK